MSIILWRYSILFSISIFGILFFIDDGIICNPIIPVSSSWIKLRFISPYSNRGICSYAIKNIYDNCCDEQKFITDINIKDYLINQGYNVKLLLTIDEIKEFKEYCKIMEDNYG